MSFFSKIILCFQDLIDVCSRATEEDKVVLTIRAITSMKKTAAGKGRHVGPIHNQEIYTYFVFYKNRDSLLKVIGKIGNYYELKDFSTHSMESEMGTNSEHTSNDGASI